MVNSVSQMLDGGNLFVYTRLECRLLLEYSGHRMREQEKQGKCNDNNAQDDKVRAVGSQRNRSRRGVFAKLRHGITALQRSQRGCLVLKFPRGTQAVM